MAKRRGELYKNESEVDAVRPLNPIFIAARLTSKVPLSTNIDPTIQRGHGT